MNDDMMNFIFSGRYAEPSELQQHALDCGYIIKVGVTPHTWYSLNCEAWYDAHCHRVEKIHELEQYGRELLAVCGQIMPDELTEELQANTREILRLRRLKPYNWKE